MNQNEELNHRIEKIESFISMLQSSGLIPIGVDQAFSGRGFIKSSSIGGGTWLTQNKSIPTTPTTITVPAQPSGTVKLNISGTVYEIPFK